MGVFNCAGKANSSFIVLIEPYFMKTLVIRYVNWGGSPLDSRLKWEASIEGELDVLDWGSKAQHILYAIENGLNFKVLSLRKTGKVEVVQFNSIKIGQNVRSMKRHLVDVFVAGNFRTVSSFIEGRVERFDMDGKMVQIKGVLYPVSFFINLC